MLIKQELNISVPPKHLSVYRQENTITSVLNIPDKWRHSIWIFICLYDKDE